MTRECFVFACTYALCVHACGALAPALGPRRTGTYHKAIHRVLRLPPPAGAVVATASAESSVAGADAGAALSHRRAHRRSAAAPALPPGLLSALAFTRQTKTHVYIHNAQTQDTHMQKRHTELRRMMPPVPLFSPLHQAHPA